MLANILFMSIGAAFIALGVTVEAVAERIRGSRLAKERAEIARLIADLREARRVDRPTTAAAAVTGGPPTEIKDAAPAASAMGKDVVAALVQAGYAKEAATAATNVCGGSERSTLEAWTRAALKRAMVRKAGAS